MASRGPFGQLHMWGTDDSGTLGQGEGVWANRPIRVPIPLGPKTPLCTQVATGWRHSAAITSEGRLLTWGWSGSYGLGGEEEVDGGGEKGFLTFGLLVMKGLGLGLLMQRRVGSGEKIIQPSSLDFGCIHS